MAEIKSRLNPYGSEIRNENEGRYIQKPLESMPPLAIGRRISSPAEVHDFGKRLFET